MNKMSGWQPIETAPTDGTTVDLWHPRAGRYTDAHYDKSEYARGIEFGWSNFFHGRITGVTHWMPLPEPPKP